MRHTPVYDENCRGMPGSLRNVECNSAAKTETKRKSIEERLRRGDEESHMSCRSFRQGFSLTPEVVSGLPEYILTHIDYE